MIRACMFMMSWRSARRKTRKAKEEKASLHPGTDMSRRNLGHTVDEWVYRCTIPRLREFFRLVETEVVKNGRNKVHQTLEG